MIFVRLVDRETLLWIVIAIRVRLVSFPVVVLTAPNQMLVVRLNPIYGVSKRDGSDQVRAHGVAIGADGSQGGWVPMLRALLTMLRLFE